MADKHRVVCNLALLMAKRNIRTITKLAEMTGLARLTLEKCYNGTAKVMNYETTIKLCMALNCELDELYIMVTEEEYQRREQLNKERKEKLQKGYVYFIKSLDTDLIKIGRSKDVEARLYQLRNELKENLVLIKKIPCENSIKVEKDFHMVFADRNVTGEWFKVSVNGIKDFLKSDSAKKIVQRANAGL